MMTLSEHKKEAMREYYRKYRQRNRARIRKLDQERRALMREERNDER
jgi:TRAP-type C4-dicarboxylate transport system substrate-binding protein